MTLSKKFQRDLLLNTAGGIAGGLAVASIIKQSDNMEIAGIVSFILFILLIVAAGLTNKGR